MQHNCRISYVAQLGSYSNIPTLQTAVARGSAYLVHNVSDAVNRHLFSACFSSQVKKVPKVYCTSTTNTIKRHQQQYSVVTAASHTPGTRYWCQYVLVPLLYRYSTLKYLYVSYRHVWSISKFPCAVLTHSASHAWARVSCCVSTRSARLAEYDSGPAHGKGKAKDIYTRQNQKSRQT